jgi:flagellar basal body rod protein FlgG
MYMRGFYNATQAMLVKQRELDAVANNINNINTPGFRKDEVTLNTFMDELIWVQGRRATHSGTFQQTYVEQSRTFLEQSSFEYTESRYDVAIWGNVYFNVADNNGNVFLTRAGQFERDDDGYLALGGVGRVQGQGGDLFIGLSGDDFVINSDGIVFNGTTGAMIGFLRLTYVPPEADMRKVADNLMTTDEGQLVLPVGNVPDEQGYAIVQGAFEKSNVDANKEMAKALELQRMFEANSTMIKAFELINSRNADMAKLNR